MPKKIAVFGSTGSIGRQSLEVIRAYPEAFEVAVLIAYDNIDLLIQQAQAFKPLWVVIANVHHVDRLRKSVPIGTYVLSGLEGVQEVARIADYDVMVAAITGCAGLPSIIAAVERGKTIALANKEAMVVAGAFISQKAKEHKSLILPVDSEHAGVFQCLQGERAPYDELVEFITLTASGGPFLGRKPNFLENVRREHALAHPVWSMGNKITIDSATLMNKGLEMIEARWLFDISPHKIGALVHPECVVHAMVGFVDGAVKVQMAVADMRIPIAGALNYPHRLPSPFHNKIDTAVHLESLRFMPVDEQTFRCFTLARTVLLKDEANYACVLNAANEVAVQAFLNNKIPFLSIADVIEEVLNMSIAQERVQEIEHLYTLDGRIRQTTHEIIQKFDHSHW